MMDAIKSPALLVTLLCFNLLSSAQVAGSLDPSFGNGGTTITALGAEYDWVGGMIIQPDQKMVIVGGHEQTSSLTVGKLTRFNTDGSLDTSFGMQGVASGNVAIGNMSSLFNPSHTLELQADGKLITTWGSSYGQAFISRFNADGSPDSTFGISGNSTLNLSEEYPEVINTIALQDDGKALIGGYVIEGDNYHFMVAGRLNVDGSLDTSFNNDGVRILDNIGYDGSTVVNIAVQSNGTILLMGWQETGGPDLAIIGLKSNGHYDQTFGNDGILIFPLASDYLPYEYPGAMVLQADDKIIVTGVFYSSYFQQEADVFIVRFDKDGIPDTTFGTDGVTITSISNKNEIPNSVTIDANGKILVAGWQVDAVMDTVAMVLRYNQDGSIDSTFGNNGFAIVPPGPYLIRSIQLQEDHKIVVAGTYGSGIPNGFEFAASRFLSDENVGMENVFTSTSPLELFPNPVKESVRVQCADIKTGTVNITLTDITGRIVYREKYFNKQGHLDKIIPVNKMVPGIYMLTVENNQTITTGKLVVK